MKGYITIEAPATGEIIEKRSRFIGEVRPLSTEQQAADFLDEKRSEHYNARHHCSAWILHHGGIERYSDDGEPQGTAGMPMLELLRHSGVQDVGVVVTRYFGGTLLGTGGLVRAYTAAAKTALEAAKLVEICACMEFQLPVPYNLYDNIQRLLDECSVQVDGAEFSELVNVQGKIRLGDYENLIKRITELTSGTVSPHSARECLDRLGIK